MFSNWRARESLDADLARNGVVAIVGVDTRALTRHNRSLGAIRGANGSTAWCLASWQRGQTVLKISNELTDHNLTL